MGAGETLPGLAAIERHLGGVAAHEYLLAVDRVHANLTEVSGPLVLVTHERPGLAAIVGAEHAAGVRIGRAGRGSASATSATSSATDWYTRNGTARGRARRRFGRCRFVGRAAAPTGRAAFHRGAAAGAGTGARLHLGVNGGGLRLEDRNRNAAVDAVLGFGPARPFKLAPVVTRVRGFPKRAAGAAAVVAPPGSPALEWGRIEDLGIGGIDSHVGEA